MIACYCRVSSRSQKTDSQKAEVTRWLQHQGLDVAAVQWNEKSQICKRLQVFGTDNLRLVLK